VTGNLYRPKEHAEKIPGVLCTYGHWSGGRFNEESEAAAQKQIDAKAEKYLPSGRHFVQAYPAQLARMGCVAFQYDMEGYCDSVQVPMQVAHQHPQWRPSMDTPHDWGFFSTPADLRLESIMGLQTYNSIRARDFLCELPEVDPKRLAVTGASSGGTQTLMICAADPRVAVAVPVVMRMLVDVAVFVMTGSARLRRPGCASRRRRGRPLPRERPGRGTARAGHSAG